MFKVKATGDTQLSFIANEINEIANWGVGELMLLPCDGAKLAI